MALGIFDPFYDVRTDTYLDRKYLEMEDRKIIADQYNMLRNSLTRQISPTPVPQPASDPTLLLLGEDE